MQDDSDLVFDDEPRAEGIEEDRSRRVKREPPPSLESPERQPGGKRTGSKLAAHGLWNAKKHPNAHGQHEASKKSAHDKSRKGHRQAKKSRANDEKKAQHKRLAALRIDDDEDMLADGSGSGDGPEIQPPVAGTRSESLSVRRRWAMNI